MTSSHQCLLEGNPGVDECIYEIHDEVDQQHPDRSNENERLDDWVVAVEDRLGGESRHAREGEDELGDDGATEQGADLKAHDGDGWNKRIAEGVLAKHADVIKALRA